MVEPEGGTEQQDFWNKENTEKVSSSTEEDSKNQDEFNAAVDAFLADVK